MLKEAVLIETAGSGARFLLYLKASAGWLSGAFHS